MPNALIIVSQLLVFFILPVYLIRLSRKYKADRILSDIVICYGIGMLLGNAKNLLLLNMELTPDSQKLADLSTQTAQYSAFGAVLLAMPLLLMVNNVTDWLKYTGKITLVFFLGIISTITVCIGMGYLYRNSLADVATVSGMMTGVYIGGTPNMVAISKALNADDHLFIILNATDTICSGTYFFFLVSFGKAVIGKILVAFQPKTDPVNREHDAIEEAHHPFPPAQWNKASILPLLLATVIALGALILSVIPAVLIRDGRGEFNQTVLMLTLTTVGIALSFNQKLRTLPGVFSYAQYLLLIFGLAAGFLTDFTRLIELGGAYLNFNVLVLIGILTLHLLLSRIVRADTDSFMISSSATIMGPPFVAQVASSIKNRELLPVGIALSLLGLGLANYAGVLVAWLVEQF
jgi:uncharacterized membrane protein